MAKESKNSNKNQVVEQITDMSEREKALQKALEKIEKDFGQGSVMKLGDKAKLEIETLSTGSLSIDLAVGIGGLPKGRIVEIYGPESSGKTTVTLHAVAEAQKNGGIAAFIDAEHALDPIYAKAIGVDVDNLIVSQPDTGEQALEIAEALIRSGAIDLIVVDSVAALVPKAEIEGEMGDSHVGLHARLMSQALRKLTGSIQKSKCVAIFINQLREKVGGYGTSETTTGGRALKFYSSVRLDVRKIDTIKQGDKVMGSRTRVKVVKNKVAPPFTQCEFDIMYGEGISKTGEVLDIATDKEIVKKSGAWYSYNETKLGQGRENVKKFLYDNKDLLEEIEQKVRDLCVIKPKGEDEEVESENIENSNVDTEKNDNKTENVKENNISSINQIGTERIL
ncbi:recombinase A,Recombinase A,recombinase A,RecA-superfamily ATPases implicated in signal transduction,protein RecA,recA bacterial DNA recombination protein [[Clostridium] sordellii]|nr:recombinase RecA [Paeniclostridium sordellii]CEK36490.1 recombinase A,Recombinase A,recombinase A,RecA-superfamily ATPases implicated in signal transduction,protein RecA,recA bacterial DNA recombination protein [[Clostridium] sordellii] [Paeniclostridium sordellii]